MPDNRDTQSTVAAVKRVVSHIERHEGQTRFTIADWQLEELDRIAALAAQPRDDVMQMAMRDSQYYEGAKAYAGMYEQNPQMAKAWLQSGCSGRDKSLSEALSTDSGPTEEQAASDGLADDLERMANGLRGSMWANRAEIIELLDKATTRLRIPDERDRALEEAKEKPRPQDVFRPSCVRNSEGSGGVYGDHVVQSREPDL